MTKYDLAVAYRIYPKVSKVPPVFGHDKYKLSEFCLESFKQSLGTLKVKMFVLLDNCPPEYEKLFEKYFNNDDLEFIKLDGIGNQATFSLQIKKLIDQNYSEIIYFAEDDYFYMPEQFIEMVEFLRENDDVDFVSPYDHLDYYTLDIHNHPNYIKASEKRHWRTGSSTCLTFLTKKKTLEKTRRIFEKYTIGYSDYLIWFCLTKYAIFNPIKLIRYIIKGERAFASMIIHIWLKFPNEMLFGKRWKLWVPMPTISIHMERDFLPPTKSLANFMINEAKK